MGTSHFWQTVRKAANAASAVINGPARQATTMQRAVATGSITSYPVGNPYEELSHGTSWNAVGIHNIGIQWAQSSLAVYSNEQVVTKNLAAADAPDEKKTHQPDHPLAKLLEDPNPVMGRQRFMHLVALQLRMTGGFVIWTVKSQETGEPCELWVLPRAWLQFQAPREGFPMGLWRVNNPRGLTSYMNNPLAGGFFLDCRECLTDGWSHPLYPGEFWSMLTACSRIIDIMEQTDLAVWSTLVNAPRPGMILSVDPQVPMTPEQLTHMTEQVQQYKSGAGTAGMAMAIQGVTLANLGTPMGDLDAVNVREQNMKFGLGIQGVPGIATGMQSDTGTYSGNAAQFNAYAELIIQPDLDLFDSSLTKWARKTWKGVRVQHSAKRIDDPQLQAQRADKLFAGVKKGLVTPNQWLAAMGLPPIPGGDELKRPEPVVVPGQMSGQETPGDGVDSDPALDLDDTPADATTTGTRHPWMQGASGNRLPAHLLNGAASTNGTH